MKKSRLSFLIVSSLLAITSLAGCDTTQPLSSKEKEPSSELPAGSDVGGSSAINSSDNNQSSLPGGSSNNDNSSNVPGSSAGGGNSSVSPGSSGGNNSSQPAGNTDWTDTQKAKMREYLHGVVLPFVNMDVYIHFDEDDKEVNMNSTANMADGFLRNYAQSFYEEDSGWEGVDISSDFNCAPGTAYEFQKAVVENGKTYYVSVGFFGAADEMTYTSTGKFYLQASDPYLYEYPAEFIGGWLTQQYNTTIIPPSPGADRYMLFEEGVLYCFSQTNLEDSYKQAIANNFTIEENKDFFDFYVAHPSDGSYTLKFKYDSNDKVFVIKVEGPKGWNASKINEVFTKHNATPFVLPAITDSSITFSVTDQEYGGVDYVIISAGKVTLQMAQDYLVAMKQLGYKVMGQFGSGEGYTNYAMANVFTTGGMYTLHLSYVEANAISPATLTIDFTLNPNPNVYLEWPAVSIARYIEMDKDSVPAFPSDKCYGYSFSYNQGSYCDIVVHVDEGQEEAARTAYAKVLKDDNGYLDNGNYYGQPAYKSANNEVFIAISYDTNFPGQIEILIKEIEIVPATWPEDDIADAVDGLFSLNPITDELPELDVSDASECYVSNNYSDKFEIVIGGLASSKDAFVRSFKLDTWKEDQYYPFDTTIGWYGAFISPNNQLVAHFETTGNDLSIYVKPYWDPYYAEWPSSQIAALLTSWGVEQDVVPSFDKANRNTLIHQDGARIFRVYILVAEQLQQATIDAYKSALTTAGYEYREGVGYVSDDAELIINVGLEGYQGVYGVYVTVTGPTAYKVLGINDVWNYDAATLNFVDATVQEEVEKNWYVSQLKAEFDVETDDEFKAYDGLDWLGFDKLAANENFVEGDEGNIKALNNGHVVLYLKTFADGTKGLFINFTKEAELTPWPGDDLATFFEDEGLSYIPTLMIPGASFEAEEPFTNDEGKFFGIHVIVENASNAMAKAIQDLAEDGYYEDSESPYYISTEENYPRFYFEEDDEHGFYLEISVGPKQAEETIYKVVGLGGNWGYDDGEELKPILEPGEGYSAQYIATFYVETGEEFKITDGTDWFGFEKLVENESFDSFGSIGGNIVAKENGGVEIKFNILENGGKEIVINFNADEDQPTELSYKIVCDEDNWDDLMAANAEFYAWVWGGEYGEGEFIMLDIDEENHCFYLNNIDVNATGFKIVRMSPDAEPSFETAWNQSSGDIAFPELGLTIHTDILH